MNDETAFTTGSVETVQAFRCSDGKMFLHYENAKSQQDRINRTAHANALLNNGATVMAAMREAGISVPDTEGIEALDRITKDTDIAIPYWQCKDQPGYRVKYFTTCGRVYLYGDAGSWTGPYGGKINPVDLIQHMRDIDRWHQES